MRSYETALKCLNELQTNYSVIESLHKQWSQFKQKRNAELMPEMFEWVRRSGYKPTDFHPLNVIHVTGTKGKGSTCAFVQSILINSNKHKVGLYTSPHLVSVRERIMINGTPISREKFQQYFFDVFDKLSASTSDTTKFPALAEGTKPMYFRFLTLMSLHAFLQEKVDSAIYEVGIGGEYDSTNVFPHPKACGISSLGIDHVQILGNTIEEIAWNKSGIFKENCPAYSVNQPEKALDVLKRRAEEKKVSKFEVVDVHPEIEELSRTSKLGLRGKFQAINATLACYLAAERLGITFNSTTELPLLFKKALMDASWPGRCQRIKTLNPSTSAEIDWFLDGAHTYESLEVAAEWFAENANLNEPITLVFNQQKRDNVDDLLAELSNTLKKSGVNIKKAVFTTNKTTEEGYDAELVSHNVSKETVDGLTIQLRLAEVWQKLNPNCDVKVCKSLENVINEVDGQVFATGSLLMVGGLLSLMKQ